MPARCPPSPKRRPRPGDDPPGPGLQLQADSRRGGVGHVHLNRKRRNRFQPFGPHPVIGEHQFLGGSHAGADRHHQPLGIHLGGAGVLPDPPTQDRGHLLQVRQPTKFDASQLAVELLDQMPTDSHRQVVLLDELVVEKPDTALPVQQLLPGAVGIGCQGGRHRNAGDDHVGEAVPRRQTSQPCHCFLLVLSPPERCQYRPKAIATLCPPNPNELLIAYW